MTRPDPAAKDPKLTIAAEAGSDGLGWSVRDPAGELVARFRTQEQAEFSLDQIVSAGGLGARTDPEGDGWGLLENQGYTRLVGPIWFRPEGEDLVFGFRGLPKHRNRRGIVHGGMIMSFADRVLGMTVARSTDDHPHATIHLDTQFVGAAEVGQFVEARCTVVRKTRSVVFVAADITCGGRPVARAQGIWKLL